MLNKKNKIVTKTIGYNVCKASGFLFECVEESNISQIKVLSCQFVVSSVRKKKTTMISQPLLDSLYLTHTQASTDTHRQRR